MPTQPKLPIDLTPVPGFCIKSHVAKPAVLSLHRANESDAVLEPATPVVVPAGRKIFINICYDKNVPPPPPADEETIRRAMDAYEQDGDYEPYYVPVVVSEPRQDSDKAGNPSLVFDCVYNSSLRSRTLRDSDFKIFLVELALQRIEAQTTLVLSRQIGTPNIAAKGKLTSRRVWVPAWLATGKPEDTGEIESGVSKVGDKQTRGKKLIEEVNTDEKARSSSNPLPKLKGILKHPTTGTSAKSTGTDVRQTPSESPSTKPRRPIWSWKREQDRGLNIIINVPKETPHEAIVNSTLDIEPRRLILHVPGSGTIPPLDLDLDLSKSDAEIVASVPSPVKAAGIHGTDEEDGMKEPNSTLLLKRQRDFNVDQATAEWIVAEGKLVVCV